jgi:hypothetical protein
VFFSLFVSFSSDEMFDFGSTGGIGKILVDPAQLKFIKLTKTLKASSSSSSSSSSTSSLSFGSWVVPLLATAAFAFVYFRRTK